MCHAFADLAISLVPRAPRQGGARGGVGVCARKQTQRVTTESRARSSRANHAVSVVIDDCTPQPVKTGARYCHSCTQPHYGSVQVRRVGCATHLSGSREHSQYDNARAASTWQERVLCAQCGFNHATQVTLRMVSSVRRRAMPHASIAHRAWQSTLGVIAAPKN